MMNGIGGSGNSPQCLYIHFHLSVCAKEGKISAIVPMVSHLDHSEHSVNIVITEQGVADLRGKSPKERAQKLLKTVLIRTTNKFFGIISNWQATGTDSLIVFKHRWYACRTI